MTMDNPKRAKMKGNETMAKDVTQTPPAPPPATKRLHRATYSTDKRNGGYLVRVAGPHANEFASREVPVTLKNGGEQKEKLVKVVWTGKDKETGENIALYKFEPKPRHVEEIEF